MLEQQHNNQDTNALQQINNELQEYLNQVNKYRDLLLASAKELNVQIQDSANITNNIENNVNAINTELQAKISELHSEILLLRNVSKTIKEYIQQEIQTLAPQISHEIEGIYQDKFTSLDKNIETTKVSLVDISNNTAKSIEKLKETSISAIEELISKSKKLGNNYLKQLGLNIAIVTVISTIISVSASYFMVQKLPNKVFIDSANNITIDKSQVNILRRTVKKQ